MTRLEGGTPRKPKHRPFHTHAEENFHDINIGGRAIDLTQGSVLFECAKHELHATTALRIPDRHNPTRIGLVFYQDKALTYPDHGHRESRERYLTKHLHDYEAWKNGTFTPTHRKLVMMREDGFEFPESGDTILNAHGMKLENIQKPDLAFLEGRQGTERIGTTNKVQGRLISAATTSQPPSVHKWSQCPNRGP